MLEREPVRPVNVLDHEQQRLSLAEAADEACDGRALAVVASGVVHRIVQCPERSRLRQVQEIVEVDALLTGHQPITQGPLGGRLQRRWNAARRQVQQAAHKCPDRVLTTTGAKIEHESGMADEACGLGKRLHLLEDASLTDAGFATHDDGLASVRRPARAQRSLELRELRAPADERRTLGRRRTYSEQAKGPDRFGQALDGERAGVATDEGRGQHASYQIRDQNGPGCCLVGQARRQVHRISGDGVFPVRRAARAACHHLARGKPDVHFEHMSQFLAQSRHGVPNRKRGAGRPLGVVAMRGGRPEHRHDAIADVLVDAAAELVDDLIDPFKEPFEELMNLLGIQLSAELGVAGQIGEEDRHLAPLARDLGGSFGTHWHRWSGRFAVARLEIGDRLE